MFRRRRPLSGGIPAKPGRSLRREEGGGGATTAMIAIVGAAMRVLLGPCGAVQGAASAVG